MVTYIRAVQVPCNILGFSTTKNTNFLKIFLQCAESHWELDAAALPHSNPTAPEGIYARVPRIPAHGRWQKRRHTLQAAPAHPRRQVAATPGRRTVGGEDHGGRGPTDTVR